MSKTKTFPTAEELFARNEAAYRRLGELDPQRYPPDFVTANINAARHVGVGKLLEIVGQAEALVGRKEKRQMSKLNAKGIVAGLHDGKLRPKMSKTKASKPKAQSQPDYGTLQCAEAANLVMEICHADGSWDQQLVILPLLAQRDKLLEAAKLALDGLFALGVGGVGCCDTDKDIKANADRCIREAREIHVALREAINEAKE